MKKVLCDVNVILDVLLDRRPHVDASAGVLAAIEAGTAQGMLAAHAVTTIHYLIRREMGSTQARRLVESILTILSVASVNSAVIQEALQSPSPDFEDAVTAASARHAGCDYIATRDPKGFRGSRVRPLTPEALISILTKP
jgi:predicted nucleic acid-binding protein